MSTIRIVIEITQDRLKDLSDFPLAKQTAPSLISLANRWLLKKYTKPCLYIKYTGGILLMAHFLYFVMINDLYLIVIIVIIISACLPLLLLVFIQKPTILNFVKQKIMIIIYKFKDKDFCFASLEIFF